jgi:DNA repair ATPase RecN
MHQSDVHISSTRKANKILGTRKTSIELRICDEDTLNFKHGSSCGHFIGRQSSR